MNERQRKTAERLQLFQAGNRIFWSADGRRPKFIMGLLTTPSPDAPEDISGNFMTENQGLFALPADFDEETSIVSSEVDAHGCHHLCLAQTVAGLPVYEGSVQIHINENGVVTAFKDNRLSEVPADREAVVGSDEARKKVLGRLTGAVVSVREPKLLIIRNEQGSPRLSWEIEFLLAGELGARISYVDAVNGAILLQISENRGVMKRLTYNAGNNRSLPGVLLMEDEAASDDGVAQAAHDNAARVYEYYKAQFGRKSYDDRDAAIISSVHFGRRYNNAYWSNWYRQMVYGDGDGRLFAPLARALDVVGHEYTHAITARTARFVYAEEAGALDESFADFFGIMISNDGEIVNWLMGEGVYTPLRNGDALRDLADPPACNQPDHMQDMLRLKAGERPDADKNDNGWVHSNSGIPNKAAYLLVAGGKHHGLEIVGIGREKAEQIYYLGLTQYLKSATRSRWTFKQTRYALLNACRQLYGDQGREYAALKNAWAAVGVGEPAVNSGVIRRESEPRLTIPDNDPAGISDTMVIEAEGGIQDLSCSLELRHSYIGDLRVLLVSPGAETVVLHDRQGGGSDDLIREYSLAAYPPLSVLKGDQAQGEWRLLVSDHAAQDVGMLVKWGLTISLDNNVQHLLQRISTPDLAIPDNTPAGVEDIIDINDPGIIVKVKVSVDVRHTYIGDLRCILQSPAGIKVVLHNRRGSGRDNLKRTYDGAQVPRLLDLAGSEMRGQWRLLISDHAPADEGVLREWKLDITWR